MQLTARQRYFARIMVWALPVSAALGAVFGGFNLPNDIIRGYVRGAVAGTLISATALLLEFVVFSRTLSALVRRVPFLLYLALRSLGYLVAILMGLAVSAWLLRASAESEPLIEPAGVIFWLVLSLGFNLLYGVSSLLGEGVLFNFIAGRYRRPRIEECVLLFIDMESSTATLNASARPASSTSLTALSPMSPDRSWRSLAPSTNMSATRSLLPGHSRSAFGTDTACAPALTRLQNSTRSPTPMFATSAAAPTSAQRCIADPWSSV